MAGSCKVLCAHYGMQLSGISKSQVSHLVEQIDERVRTFLSQPIEGSFRTAFTPESQAAARKEWRAVTKRLRERFRKIAELMEEAEEDCLPHMAFHKDHWAQLRSTNPLERLNAEINRRTDVVAIFPNEEAIVRLVGGPLLEQNDEWTVQRRYMSRDAQRIER